MERPVVRPQMSIGPRTSQVTAQKYLPDVPWTHSNCAKLFVDGLHCYFSRQQMLPGNTGIELSPVAMVWNPESKSDQPEEQTEPIIIIAEKATFHLDQPAELSEIRTHLIREVMLRGKVLLRSAEGLNVAGNNFVFSRDNSHIRSDFPVTFAYHGHRGSAQNIQLNLKILDGGQYADNPQVQSISDLFTRGDFELNLEPGDDEPPVLVTCDGRFQFRFDSQLATLTQNVFLYRTDEHGLVDSLTCNQLDLQFAESTDPTLQSEQWNESTNQELVSFIATGEEVIAKSSSNQLSAVGEELSYHLKDGLLTLRKNQGVEVQYRGVELFTPRMQVQLDDEQQPVSARCEGPGQLEYHDPEKASVAENQILASLLLRANWKESLVFQPASQVEGEYDLVTLTGKAVLRSPVQKSGILSETLKIWLNRMEDQATASRIMPESEEKIEKSLRIVRAMAENEVAIASPYLEGEYESLDIHFAAGTKQQLLNLLGDPEESKSEHSLVSIQNVNREEQKPFRVDASHLEVHVLHDQDFKQVHVGRVKTWGKVDASGMIARQNTKVHLLGNLVEIENQGSIKQQFHLFGANEQLASIRQNEMRIDGIDLYVNREQNLSRVMGKGSLEFPVYSDWNGKRLPHPQMLEISWKEKMTFQGKQARFIGGVKATLGDSVITCEELIVELDQPISLQVDSTDVKPQIAQIECKDRVRFDMQLFESGKLTGVRKLQVHEFSMNHLSGKIFARGPGQVEFWQKRNGKNPLGLPEGMMQNKTADGQPKKEQGWDYTLLTFAGEMNGNIHRRFTALSDRVNILHGPVEQALVQFDRDHRPSESVWIRCDRLEALLKEAKLTDENSRKWSVEVQARGNAQIEGDQFMARSDIIAYDDASQFFTLRSLENRYATIWQYDNPLAPRNGLDVKMIRLSPNGNILELDQTLGVSGSR